VLKGLLKSKGRFLLSVINKTNLLGILDFLEMVNKNGALNNSCLLLNSGAYLG
jgi:hypothetical protein